MRIFGDNSLLCCPQAADEPARSAVPVSRHAARFDSMLLQLQAVIDSAGLWRALQSILNEIVPNDACVVYFNARNCSSNDPTIHGTARAVTLQHWMKQRHENELPRSLSLVSEKAKVCQLSDVLFDPRQLDHAEFFRRYMVPAQWHYIARLLFWQEDTICAEIAIARTAEQGKFIDHEMAALDRLHPHIEVTLERLVALETRVRGNSALRSALRLASRNGSNGHRDPRRWPDRNVFDFDHGRSLTPAESQLVCLLHAGLSNKEIAARLKKSVRTVKTQLTSVYRKYGVRSRARLLATILGVAEQCGPRQYNSTAP